MQSELIRELKLEKMTYLGPATVTATEGRRVQLECPDALPWAEVAIAQSYAPVEGDVVLAIGRENSWYVIGLLQGGGATTFTVPGDLQFHAPRGKIELLAAEGINLRSERVEIVASRLEMTARVVFERFLDATLWVTGALHRRIGRMNTKVDADYNLRAGRITEQAEGDVKIDGKIVHLG